MDNIRLEDISVETRIGVETAERASLQTLLITLEIFHPLQQVSTTDDVQQGIDYQSVTNAVLKLGTKERKTIESFAEDTAVMILHKFKPTGGVRVTVKKSPPLPLKSASVTIIRP